MAPIPPIIPPSPEALKRASAARALDYVQDGMKLGIGTGTTADVFMELLAEKMKATGLRITGTPTSQRTAEKCRALNIPIVELDALAPLDLTIDGADEADRDLNLIKGGGGALLREKIVAASSARMVVIADESKLVRRLGAFPLPIEVVPFGHGTTLRRIVQVAHALGYGHVVPALRMKDYAPYMTDNGNFIYDCNFKEITDTPLLAVTLSSVPGVVDHGLFVGIATALILGGAKGVQVIEKKK